MQVNQKDLFQSHQCAIFTVSEQKCKFDFGNSKIWNQEKMKVSERHRRSQSDIEDLSNYQIKPRNK